MKKFRIGLGIVSCILLAINLAMVDYTDLSWSKNSGAYIRILSNVCLLGVVALSIKESKKNHAND